MHVSLGEPAHYSGDKKKVILLSNWSRLIFTWDTRPGKLYGDTSQSASLNPLYIHGRVREKDTIDKTQIEIFVSRYAMMMNGLGNI